MEKNNQQIYLQKYKVFEDWAREHFPKMQDMHYLENNYALRDYCKTLEFYRYVRNILTHYGHFARSITSESTIPECKYKFTRAIEKNERLDILFFTEDGTYQTPLKGLITIWDMPAINHDSDNS